MELSFPFPGSESSRERKFHPIELSFPGAKVLRNESSSILTKHRTDRTGSAPAPNIGLSGIKKDRIDVLYYSAAKVLRRPCGRFIPSLPIPSRLSFLSFPSPPLSSPSLPFP